ncbi:MAG: helix-turn-helix transcriptional regulator [Spirochaetales bacterium]|nr:helix-turn-helix transcriptional regulator [Spirochaetales bacterium]
MNSENKKINNRVSKPALSKNKNLILIVLPLILIIPLSIYFLNTKEYILFPENKSISCYTYADSSLGGNSRILEYESNDSRIIFKYQFGNSIELPFTGLTFMADRGKPIKLKDFSQIYLNMESDFSRISLYIKYFIPGYSVKDVYPSYNTKEAILNCPPDQKTFTLNLKDFSTPSWWYEMNGTSKDIEAWQNEVNLDYEISIGFTGLTGDSKIYSLTINHFSLRKDYTVIIIIGSILLLSYYFFLLIFANNKKKIHLDSPIRDSLILYLSENFNQPDITLKKSAHDLGMNPKTIEQFLHHHFRRDFKTYIMDLKLEKAKEILKNTNNNISEIAYFLGFKYPSYFNRIFLRAYGLSPGEYRKQHNAIP